MNIHQAKTHHSRLVDLTANGRPFIIAKAGRPLVKVTPIGAPEPGSERQIGFLIGHGEVLEDFDRMGSEEIERLFNGGS